MKASLSRTRFFLRVLSIILVTSTASAQAPLSMWGKSIGTIYNDDVPSFALDPQENVYTAGMFDGTIDFDPGPMVYNLTGLSNSIYITKLDSSGNFKWAKAIGSSVTSLSDMRYDNASIYITGVAGGTVDVDPGAGVFNVMNGAFVCKYDTSGNFIWARQFDNVYTTNSITLDKSGNVIVSGLFYNTVDFDPGSGVYNLADANGGGSYYVCKLDASGNFIWANAIQYNGNTSYGYSICVKTDGSNHVYLLANFGGTIDADPGVAVNNLTAVGSSDLFINKLDSTGSLIWVKHIGSNSAIVDLFSNKNLAIDTYGNVFYTGCFVSYVDFDPSSASYVLNSASSGAFDIFLSKLDMNGNFVWAKRIGDTSRDAGSAIAINASGNVYLTGSFTGYCDFDPGIASFMLSGTTSFGDVFVAEFDTYGTFLNACSFAGPQQDGGMNIACTEKGTVYMNGTFKSSLSYAPAISLSAVGGEDIFTCKLKGFNTSTNVWPGDANSDGIVDNTDVLELGLHFTQTGPARATTSNAWQSYAANNWAGTISNGKNVNHSDCNGDGIINSNDTLAIFNNYGLTHAFKQPEQIVVNPALSIVPDQSIVTKGNWGTASVFLGEASAPITNINGLAFTLSFDQNLIESNSFYIEYPISFINAGNQNLKFSKPDFTNGKLYTATTHTVTNNVSGNGKIAILHYRIKSNLATDDVLNIGITQVKQSNASGALVPLTSGSATVAAIGASVGIDELSNGNTIGVYPNPANSFVTIHSNSKLGKIELISITGQVLLSEVAFDHQYQLHLADIANGIYFINVYGLNEQMTRKKLIVNH